MTVTRANIATRILAFSLAALLPHAARAENDVDNYWSQTAAACKVTDVGIQGDAYLITAGTVKHKGLNTGTIILVCGVEKNTNATTSDPYWGLFMSGADPGGNGTFNAYLWQRSRTTGALTQLTWLNESFPTTEQQQSVRIFSGAPLNFEAYHYYVYATLARSSTTYAPYIASVGIGKCESSLPAPYDSCF